MQRVVVRVGGWRPSEGAQEAEEKGGGGRLEADESGGLVRCGKRSWEADRVLGPDTSNEQVRRAVGLPFLASMMRGARKNGARNAVLVTYGAQDAQDVVLEQIVEDSFECLSLASVGASVCALEIDSTSLVDMLARSDRRRKTYMSCKERAVSCGKEAVELFRLQRNNRLKRNGHNLSHFLFILRFPAKNQKGPPPSVALVSLGSSPQRTEEADPGWSRFFEKTMFGLSRVADALQANDSHVPYRDSKLTSVLKPILSENPCRLDIYISANGEQDNYVGSALDFCTKAGHETPEFSKGDLSCRDIEQLVNVASDVDTCTMQDKERKLARLQRDNHAKAGMIQKLARESLQKSDSIGKLVREIRRLEATKVEHETIIRQLMEQCIAQDAKVEELSSRQQLVEQCVSAQDPKVEERSSDQVDARLHLKACIIGDGAKKLEQKYLAKIVSLESQLSGCSKHFKVTCRRHFRQQERQNLTISHLQDEQARLQARVERLQTELQDTKNVLNSTKRAEEELLVVKSDCFGKLRRSSQQIKALKSSLACEQENRQRAGARACALQIELGQKLKVFRALENELCDLGAENQRLRASLQSSQDECKDHMQKQSQYACDQATMSKSLSESESELHHLRSENQSLRASLKDSQDECKDHMQKQSQHICDQANMSRSLSEFESELHHLRSENQSLRASLKDSQDECKNLLQEQSRCAYEQASISKALAETRDAFAKSKENCQIYQTKYFQEQARFKSLQMVCDRMENESVHAHENAKTARAQQVHIQLCTKALESLTKKVEELKPPTRGKKGEFHWKLELVLLRALLRKEKDLLQKEKQKVKAVQAQLENISPPCERYTPLFEAFFAKKQLLVTQAELTQEQNRSTQLDCLVRAREEELKNARDNLDHQSKVRQTLLENQVEMQHELQLAHQRIRDLEKLVREYDFFRKRMKDEKSLSRQLLDISTRLDQDRFVVATKEIDHLRELLSQQHKEQQPKKQRSENPFASFS